MEKQEEIFQNMQLSGNYPHLIDSEAIYKFAHTFFSSKTETRFLIVHDMRDYAQELTGAFLLAAKNTGKTLDNIGVASTDLFRYALQKGQYTAGVVISGETEAEDYVEVKVFDNEGVQLTVDEYRDGFNSFTNLPECLENEEQNLVDYDSDFKEHINSQVELKKIANLKIILDAGNGLGNKYFQLLKDGLENIEIIELYSELSHRFPHHLPVIENTQNAHDVIKHVKKRNADFGVVWDFWGSEFILITDDGKVATKEMLNTFFSENYPGKDSSLSKLAALMLHLSSNNQKLSDVFPSAEELSNELDEEDLVKAKREFNELLNNFWFSWNPHYILPVIDMYGDGWRKNSPPSEFLVQFGEKKLNKILGKKSWEIQQNYRNFHTYLETRTWFDDYCKTKDGQCLDALKQNPVAYFCLEYGLIDWLQIYSGGLGVLAGDFLKQASDMGIPMIAVGIFYHEGYFHQDFGEHGEQLERYIHQDPDDYPMELAKDDDGNLIEITIEVNGHDVYVRAWKLKIGRVDLYLLDTNYNKNEEWSDRMINAHLYGGTQDTRVRQEILLGIGGARLINKMGIHPSVYHMNEGHSGFLVLERAKQRVLEGMEFHDAVKDATQNLVFTNHTLKRAGNDIFPYSLMEQHFESYTDDLQTSMENIFELGKDDEFASGEFSMTVLGMRYSKLANAVSILHGKAAKKLWPDYDLIPITNGVHMPTWVSPEIHKLLDKYVGEEWHYSDSNVDYSKVQNIPHQELWNAHKIRKQKLIETLNNELDLSLDSDALTIAWSRRLASYKRPDMIVSDLEKLKELVSNPEKPIQILIAGKAHPKDTVGKELLQRMNQSLMKEEFKNRVVIIPGYNWQLARRMISGADVWLNTPYRFEEASGTSGMKAAANGALQLTTKDGWTDEVDWYQKGWIIEEENPVKSLHDTLEYQVAPLFFDSMVDGYNKHWVEMMLNGMELVLKRYSMARMMQDYLDKVYIPIINRRQVGEN